MILSIVFVALLASAAVAERNLKPYRFESGKTYLYAYSARLQTGIPKISDQFSNFHIQADITIRASKSGNGDVRLELGNVWVGQLDGSRRAEDATEMHEWSTEYQRELIKPILFNHQNGCVVSFKAQQSEPEWSINIKKSILSLFNVNLQPKSVLRVPKGNLVLKPVSQEDLTFFGVMEQGMGGECETTYELNQIRCEECDSQELVLNVTKTRNYDNCKSRPVLIKDNFSLQHQEQHGDDTQSIVKGYYPIPSGSGRLQEKNTNTWREDATVKQYNSVKYNISLSTSSAMIEGIFSEGRVVYNTFGDKIVAITQQNVTLKNKWTQNEPETDSFDRTPVHESLSYQLPKIALSGSQSQQVQNMRMDIPHMSLFGQPKASELVKKMPEHFRQLAREVLSTETSPDSKDAMQSVIEIVNTFASLPRDALDQLFKQIAEPGRDRKTASPEKQMMRKILLDCLALCGTNDAVMLIKQKIVSHQVTSNEARELLEAVPHNMFLPDVKTIDAYLELCQHPRVVNRPIVHTAAAVCFGKLVQIGHKKSEAVMSGEWSRNSAAQYDQEASDKSSEESAKWESNFPQKKITHEDIERYVVVAGRLLQQADTFQKKVAAIESLAHIGVAEALEYLKPYLTGNAGLTIVPGYDVEEGMSVERERDYLRKIAIYATAHIAKRFPKQVQPLLLPVYRNTAEPHQVRIAAFTIVMLCQPEQHILESIAADLQRESDKQVISFVASALKSVGSLKTPCLQKLAAAATNAAASAPKAKLSSKSSRFVARDYFDAKKSFGLMGMAEVVQSRRSSIPDSGYLNLVETTGEFHEQLLEIGFSAKGLEKLVHRIVGRNGVIASLLQNKQSQKSQKRNMVPIETASQIFRQQISSALSSKNGKDSARLDVFFKLFERTSIYALDEAALFDLIDDAESAIDSWTKDYTNGYTGTFAKVFMPSSFFKVIPSELGLPIVVSHKNPVILSFRVRNAKLDRRNSGFQISAEIEPKCMHSSYTFLFGIVSAQKTAVGTHVEKTTQASLPIKIRVAYKQPENKWSVSIKPKPRHEIFYHKCEAKTFVSRVHVATTPSREWLETAQSIRNPESTSAKMEKRLTYKNLPVAAQMSLETEEKLQDQKVLERKVQKNGLIPTVVEIFQNPGLNAREVHINLEAQEDESAYDYEWDMDMQSEEEERKTPSARKEDESEEYEYDSSEESHEEEVQDSLMEEIFSRVNNVISGKPIEHNDMQKMRQSAGHWIRKAKQSMRWTEDYKDYESVPENWNGPLLSSLRVEERQQSSRTTCQTLKTQYVRDEGRICFTTRPVLSCASGCQSTGDHLVTRDFHCLPMSSAFTNQLVAETERNVLSRLVNKRVDFSRPISAPVSCSA